MYNHNCHKRPKMQEHKQLFKNSNHLASFNNMRLAGQLCDVTIKVKDKEFPVHKIVLAANLKYFQSMFLNSFHESTQGIITMQDVEETDLETFLCYAYTGEILLTDSNALGLLKLVNYLNEDTIKEACLEFLKQHLKQKDACKAYQFANAIDCLPLKSVAKQTISSNFKKCSQTAEYYDFDCESLKQILDNVELTCKSQKNLFDGLIRWILHDVDGRQVYMSDLLSLIDMSKLDASYLIEYFCKITKKQSNIAQDIMIFYHEKMQEINDLRQSLLIIGTDFCNNLQVQFYDFKKKKWCQIRHIEHLNNFRTDQWAILNNKVYYTLFNYDETLRIWQTNLHILSLPGEENTTLSFQILLRRSAICASTNMLYFCGGEKNEEEVSSNQFLRYDPQTNSFATLPPMKTGRTEAAAVFYEGCVIVLGGYNESYFQSSMLNSVEKYDFDSRKWMTLPSMIKKRNAFGVAILDGKLYACGGSNTNTVEVYDPARNCWNLVANMNRTRNPFNVIAHDGKIFAIGGDEDRTVEVYDPNKNRWQIDQKMSSGMQIRYATGGGLVASIF